MARVLRVSASGDDAWRSRPPSAGATAEQDLLRRIRTIHAASRGTYGAPRVHAELQAEGVAIAKKRVARLMQAAGITDVSRRRGIRTTRHNPADRPASDLVRRNFFVAAPSQLWVAGSEAERRRSRRTHHLHPHHGRLPVPGGRAGCLVVSADVKLTRVAG
ncbi:IS3 family transposase [Thermaurantiacus sp.]